MSERPGEEGGTGKRGLLVLRLAALAILLLGVVAIYETLRISERSGFGPRDAAFFPLIITGGLLLFGALFFLRTTVWPDPELQEQAASEDSKTSWATVGALAVVLLVYVFVLGPLGYVIATSIFLPVVARILGSERLWRDVAVGVVLSLVIYVGFTQFLGVRLPGGVFELFL